ncbi:MAG: prolyl oligopeptidase family serine peptidase, partial [Archangium sp.]|nr:prolyl oligopeptidase family serine peptidase [Archangium sp.]
MHRRALVLLALVAASPAFAEPTSSQFLTRSLTSDAGTTPYRVYVPPEYDGGTALPLLVFLHGAGERGTNNTAQLNNNGNGSFALISDANRAVQPMFMLAPQSTAEWSTTIPATNLPLIVDQLVSTYNIDPARLYVTGISMGGNGTWFALKQYPSLWAAAIPQSGWGAGSSSAYKDIPVWNFHAANDTTVGPAGSDNAVSGLRNAGGVQVIYTRYATGGHGIWPQAYRTPLLFPWLISHRKTGIARRPPAMFVDTVSVALVSGARQVSATGHVEDNTIGLTSVEVRRVNGATATVTGTTPWSSSGITFATNTTQYLLALAHLSNFHATWGGETTASTSLPITIPSSSSDYTAPTVAIVAPSSSGAHSTALTTVAISGTASDNVGVTRVWWDNDRGGTGDATGTTSWSIGAVPLVPGVNAISVHARDLTGNVATAFILVTSTAASADVTSPTVSITGPTSSATFSTTNATVSLSGTASDNVGVSSVSWVNDRGGAGNATGTSTWTASNLALSSGAN